MTSPFLSPGRPGSVDSPLTQNPKSIRAISGAIAVQCGPARKEDDEDDGAGSHRRADSARAAAG